jgi:hypothetical protein
VCSTAAAASPAVAAQSRRTITGWPTASLALSGKSLIFARSTAPRITPGGFVIHRTDTLRYGLSGTRLTGRFTEEIIYRTSAGRTTAGPISADATGRYIIIATGAGTPPQPIFCCTSEPRDIPLEPDGRADAPITLAAALDGPLANYILRRPDGSHVLVSYTVSDAKGQPTHQRVARPFPGPNPAVVAMGPGIIASVPADNRRAIDLATTAGGYEVFGGNRLEDQTGDVSRLLATRNMIVALVATGSGSKLVRLDAPTWTGSVIWRGTRPPALIAVGDRTVVYADKGVVTQSLPGRLRTALRPRGKIVALATDGRRLALAERSTRGPRKTILTVASVLQPPGAYAPGGGS